MSTSKTPETDAIDLMMEDSKDIQAYDSMWRHARRLETERDELREQVSELVGALRKASAFPPEYWPCVIKILAKHANTNTNEG